MNTFSFLVSIGLMVGMLAGCVFLAIKGAEAMIGMFSLYNNIVDDIVGSRKQVPVKRPMSDNNTCEIPSDPHYK